MTSEIKPRMVDGEAFCDVGCPRYSTDTLGGVELMCKDSHAGTCVAYDRARVAELEAECTDYERQIATLQQRLDDALTRVFKAERQLAERDAVIEGVARCRDRCTDSTEPTMPVYRDDLTLYRELDKIYTLVNGHNQRTRRPHPAERGRR